MENQFKNKQKKPTFQNADVVKKPKPPHPKCTMTKDELKEMSQILPTAKIRNRFVFESYFLGRNPDELMKIFLSDPEIRSMIDDMELTGCAPRIPAKFRVGNSKKPGKGGPPKDNRGKGPPGRAGPPDNQFFRQQCQRLISNMSNVEATGIVPLEMSGLGEDEMDNGELVLDQQQFDGRQPRLGQDNINLSESDPSLGSIANLPGVDGPLKHQYERLLSNVNKIGGFRNINMDYPVQNHQDSSGPGPSAPKRKNFHTRHTVTKKGRFQERSGPAYMQQGPNHSNPHPRNLKPSRESSFSEEPNMLAQMQPRSGRHQEVHGNMPRHSNEFHGDMPPFNDRPQGNMPPFNDSHHGNMPPFHDGPQDLSFRGEFHGDVVPFNNGPRGNMRISNHRSRGNNMPGFNNEPQGNMLSFNNGPQGNMPPFPNGPHGNMPSFNNSGSHGNMLPTNEPQNNMQPPTPSRNRQPFNNEFHRDWPPSGQSHSNMIPDMPPRDQPSIPSFRSRENSSHPSSHQSMEQRPLPNSRRPTTRDEVSRSEGDPRAPMFIVPYRYPSEQFSEKQMDAIENAILDAILEIEDERLKPTFQDSFRSNGRYGVICNDQLSKNWLFGYLSKCRPWPYASFRIISAQPTKIKANALLPLCKNDDDEKILKFIAKQNTKLNVGQWEVVQRLDSASNTTMNLAIDEESANVLKGSSTINFKMGRAEIVVGGQSVTGKVDELITTAIQKKNDLDLRMSGSSHLDHTGAHSGLMPSNQKPRSKQELHVRGRDPGLEQRNFEWPEAALSSREVVQLPPPPPPRAIRDAMKRLGSSEYGGGNEYEPSRSDRFFRTPSPEPRSMPDTNDHSRQGNGPTAQPYQIPKSGIDRGPDHSGSFRNTRKEPLHHSSMKPHRVTTTDGNLRIEHPLRDYPPPNNQRPSQPPPSRSSHMNFTPRQ